MRILYGVFGYGRGHATRALAVLPWLTRQHDVLLMASGDAYDALAERYPVVRLPGLAYIHNSNGRHSAWRTINANWRPVVDAVLEGPTARRLQAQASAFRPDVAISDAEPWVHRIADRLHIPRVAFDHFGVLAHCKLQLSPQDRLRKERDVALYRWLIGRPERVIVSSFFPAEPSDAQVRCVGPLLREDVKAFPASRGAHFLAYLNRGEALFTPRLEAVFRSFPERILVYGTGRSGSEGNLEYRPPSNVGFLRDLASCRGVISTAGNQLVGECVHYAKPLLVTPEDCLEQRVNGSAIQRLNFGVCLEAHNLDLVALNRFVEREHEFRDSLTRFSRQPQPDARMALEECVGELAASRERPVVRSWGFA